MDQERAPIFETLTGYARSGIYGFHTPGHKGGRFAAPEISQLVGNGGLALDLPAMTATDNTFHPEGCLREAQRLAAELLGAAESFFLTAGSTLGVAAAMVAAVPHGRTIALPRNIHRSVVAGLVLSGALPRFVPHAVLPECGALGFSPAALAQALDTDPHPAAVLLTRPSYYGLARELSDLTVVCRDRRVPLIVDEAHGAHLHFLPAGSPCQGRPGPMPAGSREAVRKSPSPALAAGADLVIQSWHKTLGTPVGSAQLHVGRGSLVSSERVQEALNVLQSTSPSFLLLASLDVTRRWLWRHGEALFAEAAEAAGQLEEQIDRLTGLSVFRPEDDPGKHPRDLTHHRRDPMRLVVSVRDSGWSGYQVERFLRKEFGIEDEMADWFNVVYVLSPHDDRGARDRLLAGLRAVSERSPPAAAQAGPAIPILDDASAARLLQPPIAPLGMPPRAAAQADKATVGLATAAGRTCAEMVMFYPPGIPLLMPGEVVTVETIEVCRQLLAAGAHAYASDTTLATLRVVA